MLPGRKIDLQAKLFSQIDMIHGMFERGAITTEQFEKRRCSLLYESIQESGAILRFLPPYSPDLNPIEEVFSKVKYFLIQYNNL